MSKIKKRILHFLVTLSLIGLGAVGFIALTASKPQLERTKPPTPVPMVLALKVTTGTQSVTIRGEGTVRPLREIQLVPQVNGKIIYVSPVLVDGGEFKEGEILIRIDPLDYQLAVTLARARIKDSESQLKVAEEEAAAAQEEWFLLYKDSNDTNERPPPLVAKNPN